MKKLLSIILIVVTLAGTCMLGGCGQEHDAYIYFGVVGDNGKIICESKNLLSPIKISNKEIGKDINFIAEPNEGYVVKQWKLNGEVVPGNKTNSFILTINKIDNINVSVEFEKIDESVLSDEQLKIIGSDYKQQYGYDFVYDEYYGTFNNCSVFFQSGDMAVETVIVIEDIVFKKGDCWTIFVYKNREFKQLEEAYSCGWLTKENIIKISEIFYKVEA